MFAFPSPAAISSYRAKRSDLSRPEFYEQEFLWNSVVYPAYRPEGPGLQLFYFTKK